MRITQALANSRNKRIQAETDAIAPQSTNLQGTVEDSTQDGLTIRTQNDGVITVAAPTGANASVGQTIQAAASGGAIQAGLPVQPMARAGNTEARVPQVRYKLRAPVAGQDFGLPGDLWVYQTSVADNDVPNGIGYIWSPVDGKYIPLSPITDELHWTIKSPGLETITLINSARKNYIVVGLIADAGTTATLSIANGGELAKGGSLDLTISATDGNPWSFTVEFRLA